MVALQPILELATASCCQFHMCKRVLFCFWQGLPNRCIKTFNLVLCLPICSITHQMGVPYRGNNSITISLGRAEPYLKVFLPVGYIYTSLFRLMGSGYDWTRKKLHYNVARIALCIPAKSLELDHTAIP